MRGRRRRLGMPLWVALLAFLCVIAYALLTGIQGAIGSVVPPEENPETPEAPQAAPGVAGCGPLRAYVLNVSQADSILVITPKNKTLLIDAGSGMKANSSSNVAAFLEGMGLSRIDVLLLTHYHEDHIGGVDDVAGGFEVGSVYHNGNCGNYSSGVQGRTQAYAETHGAITVVRDMELALDDCLSNATLIVAYDRPQGCWNSASDSSNENDNSILLRVVYGNTSMLFTGDCEAACEQELLSQGTELHADFLKAGHHGSATSSTLPFLEAVGARHFVVSTDRDRSVSDGYFHPRQLALESIYSAGGWPSTFRTDLNGIVSAISDGKSLSVSPEIRAGSCDIFSGYASSGASTYAPIPEISETCD